MEADSDTHSTPPSSKTQEKEAEDHNDLASVKSDEAHQVLNFPFLKDYGTDPLNAAHYFHLTLGGSMARKGNESHLKILKQMFPLWFDPHYLSRQRQTDQLSVSQTHLLASPSGINDAMFRASSTNLDPDRPLGANFPDTHSYSTISSPRTQTTSSSFHLSNLPTPRLSYHSISSNPRQRSSRSSIDSKSPRTTKPEVDNNNPLTDSTRKMNHDQYYGMGIAFKEGINLFPQYTDDIDEKNENNGKDSGNGDPLFDSSYFKNLPLGWSSEIMDSPCNNIIPVVQSPRQPKVLWRKAASAGKVLRSFKNKSGIVAVVGSPSRAQSRPKRSQSSGNLHAESLAPLSFPSDDQSRAPTAATTTTTIATTGKDSRRRSSVLSQSGRRTSVVERLFDDIKDLSEMGGVSSRLQRRRRSSRRISEAAVFLQVDPSPRVRGQALLRFRRLVRVIQIIIRVCWKLKSYVREKDSTDWSFYELYLHLRNDISPNLFFDRQQFSKIEPPKGGRRLERLLSIPPYLRTPDKIQQILAFVRTNQTFQQFPPDAQVKFCQVMQYQSYDPRVVILKEGHPPSCFYLILSGSLMVNVRQTNPVTGQMFVQTVGMMEQGECFGEIALLECRLRTATVVCKSRTELLVIYKEDFDRIVRKPLFQQRDDNIKCCISHNLFKEFPKEIFYTNPGHFFYQYFPKESVISMNSNDCPFLILVKSGECQLLGSYKKFDTANDKQASISREVESLFPLYTDKKRAGTAKARDKTSTRTDSVSAITSALESTLLKGGHVGKLVAKPMTASKARIEDTSLPMTPTFIKNRSKTMSNVFDQLEKDKRTEMTTPDKELRADEDSFWSSKLCGHRRQLSAPKSARARPKDSKFWRVLNEDAKEFVQVATLKQGYVFGLEMLAGVDSPPLTVVSGGVECILVSKQLFLTHANIKSLRVAGDLVTVFPPSSSLRQQINVNRKWQDYKKDLVAAVVSSNA